MMKIFAITLALAALGNAGPATAQQQAMPNMQMPGDMRHPASANPPAASESRSMRSSEAQQQEQAGQTPGPSSDAGSAQHNTMALDEPENPGYHVGPDAGAPNLLDAVAARPALTLAQFLGWAARGNPSIGEAAAAVRRSEQLGRQAGLYPNPSAAYDGEHIRGGSYDGGEQGAYVQQTVILGGKLGLRRNIYQQQAGADRIGVEEQQYRVKASVEQAFYRTLTAQATVVLRQKLMRVAADAEATAHQLSNVGQADAPDVLQAEVEAEQARVDFVDAQRDFLAQFRVLASLANQPELPASPLSGSLEQTPELQAAQQVEQIVATSPMVQRARQEVAVAEARVKDARREAVPDLTLRAGEWWSGEQLPGIDKPAGPMSFASAGVELPLWNRNQGNVEAAKAEVERARQNVTRTELVLRRDAEPLAQQYLASRYEVERYRTELIPRAKRAYELYGMKYAQMAAAYPQVLLSQRTLFGLQIRYLQALDRVWSSALALENYDLSGGLGMPDEMPGTATAVNLPNGGGGQ